jgi:hypothetical protein
VAQQMRLTQKLDAHSPFAWQAAPFVLAPTHTPPAQIEPEAQSPGPLQLRKHALFWQAKAPHPRQCPWKSQARQSPHCNPSGMGVQWRAPSQRLAQFWSWPGFSHW